VNYSRPSIDGLLEGSAHASGTIWPWSGKWSSSTRRDQTSRPSAKPRQHLRPAISDRRLMRPPRSPRPKVAW